MLFCGLADFAVWLLNVFAYYGWLSYVLLPSSDCFWVAAIVCWDFWFCVLGFGIVMLVCLLLACVCCFDSDLLFCGWLGFSCFDSLYDVRLLVLVLPNCSGFNLCLFDRCGCLLSVVYFDVVVCLGGLLVCSSWNGLIVDVATH